MSLPLTPGSNPETATLTAGAWTEIAAGVNAAVIKILSGESHKAWYAYVTADDDAPADLSVEKEFITDDIIEFKDSVTARDLYIYPVDKSLEIKVMA